MFMIHLYEYKVVPITINSLNKLPNIFACFDIILFVLGRQMTIEDSYHFQMSITSLFLGAVEEG